MEGPVNSVTDELVTACRQCVEAYAADDDRLALECTVAMLRHPLPEVTQWLTGALVVMSEGLDEADLAGLSSRRLTDPTAVVRTIGAVRARDHDSLLELAGGDPIDLAIHCAAVLACLI